MGGHGEVMTLIVGFVVVVLLLVGFVRGCGLLFVFLTRSNDILTSI